MNSVTFFTLAQLLSAVQHNSLCNKEPLILPAASTTPHQSFTSLQRKGNRLPFGVSSRLQFPVLFLLGKQPGLNRNRAVKPCSERHWLPKCDKCEKGQETYGLNTTTQRHTRLARARLFLQNIARSINIMSCRDSLATTFPALRSPRRFNVCVWE